MKHLIIIIIAVSAFLFSSTSFAQEVNTDTVKVWGNCGMCKKTIETAALADENVQRFIEGKQIRKVICVPGRLVNIVVSG